MAIRLKPKHFGPLAMHTDNEGSFVYTTDTGHSGHTGSAATSDSARPSDLIMAALASCICISLEMAAKSLKVDPGGITVEIRAAKALDLPSRFGSFAAVVTLEKVDDEDIGLRLLRDAKEMCTVSNTLNAEVSLSLG
jgi:uncharacterized OsmC-like protein